MNYLDIVQSEFHHIAGGTFKFMKEGGQWSARRAHALMGASKVYTHKSKETLIQIIEEENSQ